MPSFSFNWNTITFSESEGQVHATITLEGTAEGFGTVLATLVAHGAGTPSGTSYRGGGRTAKIATSKFPAGAS
jgi:hypothetical protein